MLWLDKYELPNFISRTELGTCRTTNFCELESFESLLSNNVLSDGIPPENQTQPYMTNAVIFGFDIMILPIAHQSGDGPKYTALKNSPNPYILIIHSPYEMPTKKTQQFYVSDIEYDIFFVTPQLNKIDDSMIGMEPHK